MVNARHCVVFKVTGSSDAELRIWKLIFRNSETEASVQLEPNLKKLKIAEDGASDDDADDDDFDAGRLKIERLGSVLRQSQDRVSRILVDISGQWHRFCGRRFGEFTKLGHFS